MLDDDLASTGCTLNHRGLSDDERSENALLRSRIDEQSRLITILKQHSDEAVQTADSLDKHNTLLAAECERARSDLTEQMKRCDMLESRFSDLASNHQHMIAVSLLDIFYYPVQSCVCVHKSHACVLLVYVVQSAL